MSEGGALDDWIAQLRSGDGRAREEAGHVLRDWLYPRRGLAADDYRRIHQALLDAALAETDEEAAVSQLKALCWSERPMPGVTGWEHLVEAAPDMTPEVQELTLALLSVSGEPAFADRLEVLAGERPHFDHAIVRKTIDGIRRTASPT